MSGPVATLPITIAIPTFRREQVLVDTLQQLLAQDPAAAEVLVLDQTREHELPTQQALSRWHAEGRIRWVCLPDPSIPAAMNRGLEDATHDCVLFLDDDIAPHAGLVAAHVAAHTAAQRDGAELVAGRVLQPWDRDEAGGRWDERGFAATEGRIVDAFMGGNFSVRRTAALAAGGFDENFVRVAYNFEREFAERWARRGGTIRYCPQAAIRHLKTPEGGTRSYGDHLRTLHPAHAVGAYYYLLCSRSTPGRLRAILGRPLRSVMTRHHLRRPWWIPVTLGAEIAGAIWALALRLRGPRLVRADGSQRS